jgi:UDP-N-acetylglucosamine acyltransferase
MTNIDKTAKIEAGAVLGENCIIGAYSIIGADVVLGNNVKIGPHVVVVGNTMIDDGTVIKPFCYIGGNPQDPSWDGSPTSLYIGKNCIISDRVTIETGETQTKIGDNCYFMTASGVGHDCKIGNNVRLSPSAGVSGSCYIEDDAILGADAMVHQKTRIGKGAMIGGAVFVNKDVLPYSLVGLDKIKTKGANIIGLRRKDVEREDIREIVYAIEQSNSFTSLQEFAKLIIQATDNKYVIDICKFILKKGQVDENK